MTILHTRDNDHGRRLDRVLRKALPLLPLSLIHRLLREGRVLVDGRPQPGDFRVSAGQSITVPPESPIRGEPPPRSTVLPGLAAGSGLLRYPPGDAGSTAQGAHPLRIIYESNDILALNKEAGMEVHGPDAKTPSLDTLVQAYLGPKQSPSLSFRPGPLHRLDKPTSGIVVFSASLTGAQRFSTLLREGHIRKQYLAIAEGRIAKPGLWEDPLLRDTDTRTTHRSPEGKPARTRYTPLAWGPRRDGGSAAGRESGAEGRGSAADGYTLLALEPETGRTHQIRVQAGAHGHPLAGDTKYGGRPLPSPLRRGSRPQDRPPGPHAPRLPDFLLHAWKLEIAGEGAEDAALLPPALEAPLPDYFVECIKEIFGEVPGPAR